MLITVQVAPATARALRSSASSGPARELNALVQEHGGKLEPMHPGSADPELERFFTADVPDSARALELSEKLQQHPAVLAAYIKPAEGLP